MDTINVFSNKYDELVRNSQKLEDLCSLIALKEPFEIKEFRAIAGEKLIPLTAKEKEEEKEKDYSELEKSFFKGIDRLKITAPTDDEKMKELSDKLGNGSGHLTLLDEDDVETEGEENGSDI